MPAELATGARIGPYELDVHLGGGGFGSVWRARNVETGLVVALKLLTADPGIDTRAEIELLAATASSRSPHVVRVLGGGTDPVPHIVMEYIDGPDYAELLTERGRLPIDEVLRVGLALADALTALRDVGIVHRDVKPGNVMVDREGTIKLTDFGIAKISGVATIATTRQAPMTMAYAAPEAWDGHADHQSDLYAFGTLLYQCLAGRTPFVAGIGQLYVLHRTQPPDLSLLPPTTPASLRELIRRCLEKVPAARPADAAACTVLLQRALVEVEEASASARTSAEPARFGPWVRRRPHETQPWAWHCDHESSGEQAVVEVHGFESWEVGEQQIRRAYEVNGRLTPFGAERILGWNRVLLRPEEAWASTPPGSILFWAARAGDDTLPAAEDISLDLLRPAVASLLEMLPVAEAAGLDPFIGPDALRIDPEGGLRVLRPGLAFTFEAPGPSALRAVLALPLGEEARRAVADAPDLASLAQRIGLPSAPALGVAQVASPVNLAGDETTVTGIRQRVSLDAPPPAAAAAAPVAAPDVPPARPHALGQPIVAMPAATRAPGRRILVAVAAGVAALLMTAGAFAAWRASESNAGTAAAAVEITSLECSPSTITIGTPVECTSVVSPSGTSVAYSWSASGGEPASGAAVGTFRTSFSAAGSARMVTLRACSAPDRCAERSVPISVNDPQAGPAPVAAFRCAPTPVLVGQPLTCTGLVAASGVAWEWRSPSASPATATGTQFNAVFSTSGLQTISVTACNTAGSQRACSSSSQTVLVSAPQATQASGSGASVGSGTGGTPARVSPPTVGSVTCTPTTVQPDQVVTCQASVSGTVERRTWIASSGSPSSSSDATLNVRFAAPGVKGVIIEVCNSGGCDRGQAPAISVNNVPPPVFVVTCSPSIIRPDQSTTCSVTVRSGNPSSWLWNAPGGSPASDTGYRLNTFFPGSTSGSTRRIDLTACEGASCSTVSTDISIHDPRIVPTVGPTYIPAPAATVYVPPTPVPTVYVPPTPVPTVYVPPPTPTPAPTPRVVIDCASQPWNGVWPPYAPSFAPGQTVSYSGNNFRSAKNSNGSLYWIFQGTDACRAAN